VCQVERTEATVILRILCVSRGVLYVVEGVDAQKLYLWLGFSFQYACRLVNRSFALISVCAFVSSW
jgi:hypothetical protein